MIYGSVCSGIEAATVAWEPLAWQAAFFSEIDAFPCALLKHYYPAVPNHGDMTRFKEWPDATLDLLVGGTPCQSFSVAGLRKGLDDPRGNLTLTYLAVADKYRPRWLVWENVPGVLSDGTGAFGAFLGGLGELGYGFAYRVLDAQYFGVPQRRRRVFVVGSLGDWRRAAAVLFELASLRGDLAPSREAGKRLAPSLDARTGRSGANQVATSGGLVETAMSLRAQAQASHRADTDNYVPVTVGALTDGAHNGGGLNGQDAYSGRIFPVRTGGGFDVAPTMMSEGDAHSGYRDEHGLLPIAFAQNSRDEVREMPYSGALAAESGMKQTTYIRDTAMQVRRLTPRECERLQGFPDDYTLVPYRGKPAADGPRYKALGNSMAVPVMRWIGERIQAVEGLR